MCPGVMLVLLVLQRHRVAFAVRTNECPPPLPCLFFFLIAGSQLWDTAFAMQALGASGIGGLYDDQVAKCYAYADATQVSEMGAGQRAAAAFHYA